MSERKDPAVARALAAKKERDLLRGGPLTGPKGVWMSRPNPSRRSLKYSRHQYYGDNRDGAGGYRRPILRKGPPRGAPLFKK